MKKKLPRFRTAEEEANFWDTHDVTDYLKDLKEVDELFCPFPHPRRAHPRARREEAYLSPPFLLGN